MPDLPHPGDNGSEVRDIVSHPETSAESTPGEPIEIFINYRREEAAGHAFTLHRDLAARFGPENVFLDAVALEPGDKWLRELRSRTSGGGVFLALIGTRWAAIIRERMTGAAEDHVLGEILTASRRDSGVDLIPVLLDDASMPSETEFKTLTPLLRRQAAHLRLGREWDSDVAELVESIERVAAARREAPPPAPSPSVATPPASTEFAARPDEAHYEKLVRSMVRDASVVPFLGSGANSSDREDAWDDADSGYLPDSDELAAFLSKRVGLTASTAHLAQVAQYFSVAESPGDLYRILRKTLTARCPPSSVHHFTASLPERLLALGAAERYQLVVTTNYDDALERAFDEAEEPFDLAVYVASGANSGKFVHVPHGGDPQVVTVANEYQGFPIDRFSGELQRTIILKIHGAADSREPKLQSSWEDNYVITESDYIDYLSQGPVGAVVPHQILGKLKYSRFLFLGYSMRDWNLRVFLQRIFGRQLPNSWAIQRAPDRLDAEFWKGVNADVYAMPLGDYVSELAAHLTPAAAAAG